MQNVETRLTSAANVYQGFVSNIEDVDMPEAVTRLNSDDPEKIRAYLASPDFSVAAFKGVRLTLRPWNQQLRQPILLSDGRMTVSVSPQEGFLHQVSELDTLGFDQPETKCRLK